MNNEAVNKAIKNAQEHGLKPREITLGETWVSAVILMPQFWQSLAESLGYEPIGREREEVNGEYDEWILMWHRCVDHLIDGGDLNSFFESLVPKK